MGVAYSESSLINRHEVDSRLSPHVAFTVLGILLRVLALALKKQISLSMDSFGAFPKCRMWETDWYISLFKMFAKCH